MVGVERLLHIYDYIRPVLDVLVLTFVLYKIYDFLSKTNSIQILRSAIIVAIVYLAAVLFDLKTLLWLLTIIAPGLVVAFAVIFQPEIRKLFLRIGQSGWFAFGTR